MDAETIAAWTFGIAVLASLWNLHRDLVLLRKELSEDIGGLRRDLGKDLSDLRCRVSRVEGMLVGAGLKIGPDPASG